MNVCIVLGTRPEIIKNYSIVHAFRRRNFAVTVAHTGQHYDANMAAQIFAACRYHPDTTMDSPYGLGKAIDWLSGELHRIKPDVVLVNGDTAAALAGAIAADYAGIELAHVEAGLRAYDAMLIEERNRQMIDAVARYLFTYTSREADYLLARPELRGRIFNVGNTTVDFIDDHWARLGGPADVPRYVFATLHRRELLGDRNRLRHALAGIDGAGKAIGHALLPLHPHTAHSLSELQIALEDYTFIKPVAPLEPLASLSHVKNCSVVITDSGVLQEEAFILGTPCVTVRETTERQLTVEHGANELVGFDTTRIIEASIRHSKRGRLTLPAIYGAAGCADRIASALMGVFVEYKVAADQKLWAVGG